jgi:hypothetical protein
LKIVKTHELPGVSLNNTLEPATNGSFDRLDTCPKGASIDKFWNSCYNWTSGSLASTNTFGIAVVAGDVTGVAALTAFSVLTGGTTSTGALQQVASLGTRGQV